MRKPLPSLSTRTEEFSPRELPLPAPKDPPRGRFAWDERPSDKIKEALLRWLEQEI